MLAGRAGVKSSPCCWGIGAPSAVVRGTRRWCWVGWARARTARGWCCSPSLKLRARSGRVRGRRLWRGWELWWVSLLGPPWMWSAPRRRGRRPCSWSVRSAAAVAVAPSAARPAPSALQCHRRRIPAFCVSQHAPESPRVHPRQLQQPHAVFLALREALPPLEHVGQVLQVLPLLRLDLPRYHRLTLRSVPRQHLRRREHRVVDLQPVSQPLAQRVVAFARGWVEGGPGLC